ncbi:MAG TPA: hypothetical protein VEU30_07935 [Thermoanaerobaculia bacterium]|nr:hypothetical protein [Thermoanaerobaculia bacterium]
MASDNACTRDDIGGTPALQVTIDRLFDRAAVAAADSNDAVSDVPPVMELLVVRVKNGKPVMACVDSKEAAQRFFAAPAEKLGVGGRKAVEEK